MFDLAFNNAIVLTDHLDWVPTVASVGIKDGRFAYIGNQRIYPVDAKEVIELDDFVMMPSLFNLHCHGDMTLARGLGDGLTLQEQNERFADHNWFQAYLRDEDRFLSRQLTYAEALLSGCGFILENMYWSLGKRSIEAVRSIGIRAALAEDFRPDFRDATQTHSAEYLIDFAAACREAEILPILASVSEEDFSADTLRTVRRLADAAGMKITAHIAETPWRMDLIEERFATTPVRYLAEQNFLGPDLIASHVVYTSPEERALLFESGTKVINTPSCEYKISDGLAAVPEMLNAGIEVGLGTDGALWNNSIDIFREMKALILAHSLAGHPRRLSPKQVLQMATINGARAVGLDTCGDIREEMIADFILLDFKRAKFRPLRSGRFENISSSLVFNATADDVHSVYIGGEARVQEGSLCHIDEETLYLEAQARGEALAEKL